MINVLIGSPLQRCKENPNLCVPYLLMASFLYYICDKSPPISDSEFDSICKLALDNWDQIQHRHKRKIKVEDLQAGTLFGLSRKQYPTMVQHAALYWLKDTGERKEKPLKKDLIIKCINGIINDIFKDIKERQYYDAGMKCHALYVSEDELPMLKKAWANVILKHIKILLQEFSR